MSPRRYYFEPLLISCHYSGPNMDESTLLNGLRVNDPSAWQELVDRFGDRLLRTAFLYGGNEEQAEEWVQETFVRCVRSVDRYRGECAIATWLSSILHNVARSSKRRTPWLRFAESMPEIESAPIVEPGLDSDALCAALALLSPEHRQVVVMRYYEDLPLADIAHRTGTALGTVKSRLHYAHEHLRRMISGLNPTETQSTKVGRL